MEKLELKHFINNIGCYVIYADTNYRLDGVQILPNGKIILICYDIIHDAYGINLPSDKCKLILRPLSCLTKEITHNVEKFIPIDYFVGDDSDLVYNACLIHNDFSYLPYNLVQLLLEWRFDVFGLIDKNLAIDINTLK